MKNVFGWMAGEKRGHETSFAMEPNTDCNTSSGHHSFAPLKTIYTHGTRWKKCCR